MNREEIELCLNSRLDRGIDDNNTIALAIYYLAKVIEEQQYEKICKM